MLKGTGIFGGVEPVCRLNQLLCIVAHLIKVCASIAVSVGTPQIHDAAAVRLGLQGLSILVASAESHQDDQHECEPPVCLSIHKTIIFPASTIEGCSPPSLTHGLIVELLLQGFPEAW